MWQWRYWNTLGLGYETQILKQRACLWEGLLQPEDCFLDTAPQKD